ncbi:hypothetical protein AVEN_187621-1 [Araneus ventricosus]|uniref:Uncharacterized protein n=1 Tax=Araneus ventricosus TaxID=182803 RepID=A0A4Y2K1J4_ARAVE|nr:hypothetical protein AVEN_187621-1 [Araneus ventricosus]
MSAPFHIIWSASHHTVPVSVQFFVIHGASMQTTQPVTSIPLGYCAYPSSCFPHFVVFLLCERVSIPLNDDRISVLWPIAPNKNQDWMKIQIFQPDRSNYHRILALTTGFDAMRGKTKVHGTSLAKLAQKSSKTRQGCNRKPLVAIGNHWVTFHIW